MLYFIFSPTLLLSSLPILKPSIVHRFVAKRKLVIITCMHISCGLTWESIPSVLIVNDCSTVYIIIPLIYILTSLALTLLIVSVQLPLGFCDLNGQNPASLAKTVGASLNSAKGRRGCHVSKGTSRLALPQHEHLTFHSSVTYFHKWGEAEEQFS